jgi:pimeloyl-ACP methyl ester carboxylesterase
MFARRIFRSVCASAFAAAVALSILACSNALAGNALPRWETLPPVPALPAPERSGHADVNGIRMYYAIFGHGLPVLLIHNGLGSADDWGGVVPILARDHTVIVADTRGFGRSTLGNQPLTYPLLAEDYVSLLQALRLHPVYLVGTSDGGIIGIDIALHHPQLLSGMFIQGANINKDGIQTSPPDLTAVRLALQRSKSEYTRLSATPDAYARFRSVYNAMPQPDYTVDELATIRVPTTVAIADHDEGIKRSHSELIARSIPNARVVVLKDVSHFAPIQNPVGYAEAIEASMSGRHMSSVTEPER